MKKVILISFIIIIFIIILLFSLPQKQSQEKPKVQDDQSQENTNSKVEEEKMNYDLLIEVNGENLIFELEDNVATKALIDKLKENKITIKASDYGSFEKVGSLEFSLPTNDKQIKTVPGDLMLYQGNQITLFYHNNEWSYTKIGHIKNKTTSELQEILGSGNVVMVLSLTN